MGIDERQKKVRKSVNIKGQGNVERTTSDTQQNQLPDPYLLNTVMTRFRVSSTPYSYGMREKEMAPLGLPKDNTNVTAPYLFG